MPQTILLVEDESSLRRLTERVLARHGYAVLGAANAQEANDMCRGSVEPIALLMIDVFMPDTSGPELAKELIAIRPDMRTLYVSGSPEAVDKGLLPPAAHFLLKPYATGDLVERIREILNG